MLISPQSTPWNAVAAPHNHAIDARPAPKLRPSCFPPATATAARGVRTARHLWPAWVEGAGSYWLERTNSLAGKYGGYRTLNLGATWSVSPAVQLDMQLLNANDGRREYVWWDGAQTLHSPGEPRSLHVALRASF